MSGWRSVLVTHDLGAIIVVVAFIMVSLALFLAGHGIPYVVDNNETFSSLNHAHNLWNFDFFRSFGLADEAASPDPAAHPVVHSHQGNFPRLFAFFIYALGARTAPSQILVTTLSIGTATILMAYAFLRRTSGELMATLALLVLITDYLMFAQWQVNTYRVWHGFFLFGALQCVHGLAEWRRRNWAIATALLYAGLFYWELVFAVFVTLTAGLYTLWVYRRRWQSVVLAGTVQAAGAAAGLALVVGQLALYLGWDGFLTDLTLTLTARNYAPGDPAFLQTLRDFYEARNIAFFYNIQSADSFAGLARFVDSTFTNVMQVSTPLVNFLAAGLGLAALLSDSRLPGPEDVRAARPDRSLAATAFISVGIFVLLLALYDHGPRTPDARAFAGGSSFALALLDGVVCVLMAIVVALALGVQVRRLSISGAPPPLHRAFRAAVYLCAMGVLVALQSNLYDRAAVLLWHDRLAPLPLAWEKVLLLITTLFGAFTVLTGRRSVFGRWHNVPALLLPLLVCGALAYAIIYRLSAGYLHSGYLYRMCPLPVFFYDILLALGLFAPIATALTLAARSDQQFNRRARGVTLAEAGAVATAIVAIWGFVQVQYVRLLPPDQYTFVKLLDDPRFRGAGILSNTYATPFGFEAQTWAYTRTLEPNAPEVPADARTAAENVYVWLADRRSNARYWRPGYYVCFFQVATLTSLARNLVDPDANRCSNLDIVRRGTYHSDNAAVPYPEIVARDPIADRWAILKLTWPPTSPPLHRTEGAGRR